MPQSGYYVPRRQAPDASGLISLDYLSRIVRVWLQATSCPEEGGRRDWALMPGMMGNYQWNALTLMSRGSCDCGRRCRRSWNKSVSELLRTLLASWLLPNDLGHAICRIGHKVSFDATVVLDVSIVAGRWFKAGTRGGRDAEACFHPPGRHLTGIEDLMLG